MASRHVILWTLCATILWPSVIFAKPILKGDTDAYPRAPDEFASALVLDAATDKELYAFQPDKRWSAASLTKLLTALIMIDRKPRWNRRISLQKRDEVGGGRLRVRPGATMTVRDLFYSSIVGSANNATMALVRSSGLGTKSFLREMNRKAKTLHLDSSHFVDPTGMSPKNISTARDLAKLTQASFANRTLQEAASTARYSFALVRPKITKTIHTTNRLLATDFDLRIHGGKTGYLEEAQHNLVVQLERNPPSADAPALLVVVLGAPNTSRMFASAKSLAEWAWKGYEWGEGRRETVDERR